MGCPSPTPPPPDPPRHLPEAGWVAEPSQAQPSRRVTQAAAEEPGDSTSQDISAEWPLCQPGLHKWHRAGDTEGQPPFVSTTSRRHPAHNPAVCAARLKCGGTACPTAEYLGEEISTCCHSCTSWGGGSGQEAAGGREVNHSWEMGLFVPRLCDRKVMAGSQPGGL